MLKFYLALLLLFHLLCVFEANTIYDDEDESESYKYEPYLDDEHFEQLLTKVNRTLVYNQGSPTQYFKIHLVIDNAAYKKLGQSGRKVQQWAQKLIGLVDALYQHANFRVHLSLLEIITDEFQNPIGLDPKTDTAKSVLVKFRNYINTEMTDKDYHDNLSAAILVSGSGWSDNTIKGRASKAPCTVDGVAIVEFNLKPQSIAYLFSHELGHIFDMRHPDEYNTTNMIAKDCACKPPRDTKGCLINSGYNFEATKEPQFTPCDVETIALQHLTCLSLSPKLFVSSKCGNNIHEPGEDCDCGSVEECNNACCDAATCTRKKDVQCARGECCLNCTIKPRDSLCRYKKDECDMSELCTGDSEWCPDDNHKIDGIVCNRKHFYGKEDGYCWDGECQTRERQCKKLWGKNAQVADVNKFDLNKEESEVPGNLHDYVNCGWKENGSIAYCGDEHKLCGTLFCKTYTPPKVYEPYMYSKIGPYYVMYSKILEEGHSSVGKVTQGARCGPENEGICIKEGFEHRCDLDTIKYTNPESCLAKNGLVCGGHGDCDQYGRCLCHGIYDSSNNCYTKIYDAPNGSPRRCFSCSDDASCAKPSRNNTRIITCQHDDMVCYHKKIKYRQTGLESNYRGCIAKEECERNNCVSDKLFGKICMACDKVGITNSTLNGV